MILHDAFTVEPWNLRETRLDLDLLAQAESVFALSNGHVGWRCEPGHRASVLAGTERAASMPA